MMSAAVLRPLNTDSRACGRLFGRRSDRLTRNEHDAAVARGDSGAGAGSAVDRPLSRHLRRNLDCGDPPPGFSVERALLAARRRDTYGPGKFLT